MESLVQIGYFHDDLQRQIADEFRCHSPEQVLADASLRGRIKGIITRSNYEVPGALIDALPDLKVISTSGVGFDGIPVARAKQRGIVVTHTPRILDAAVSELAIGLLLALLREIGAADFHVRHGGWKVENYRLTTSLAGKRVGIVGLGRIGKGIAERLKPFGVILAYSGRQQQGVPYTHFPDPETMAPEVDVMVISCKGGPETHHLIDRKVLRALDGGYLVNVSRGTVVDEVALCEALVDGLLRGAALDVFEQEPLEDSPLVALANVVLSPHAGSATHETRQAMLRLTLDNLHAVIEGRAALTPVPEP